MVTQNPLISLQVQAAQPGEALFQGRQAAQQQQLTRQAGQVQQEQLRGQRLQNFALEDQIRLKNAAISNLQFLNALESRPPQEVLALARQRKQRIEQRIAQGEPLNTIHTDRLITALESGDPQQIEQIRDLMRQDVAQSQQLGFLPAPEDTRTSFQKDFEYIESIQDPEVKKRAREILTKPSTQINLNEQGLPATPTQETIEKTSQELFTDILSRSQSLPEQNFQLNQTEDLILSGASTGPLAGARILASQLGVEIPDGASLEVIRANTLQDTIPKVKQLGVNPTDKDFEIVLDSVANVGKSPQANLALIDIRRQINERLSRHADIIRRLGREGKQTSEIETVLRESDRKNPFVTPDLEEISKKLGEAPKLPEGVDPELIQFMTPEERKLFQDGND